MVVSMMRDPNPENLYHMESSIASGDLTYNPWFTSLPFSSEGKILFLGHSWAKGEKKRSYSQRRQGLANWSSNGFRYLANGSGSGDVQVR